MDGSSFDALTKRLAGGNTSRRRFLQRLGGILGVAALAGAGGEAPVAAEAGGNSACAAFCDTAFPPGPDRGQCKSDGAQGGGLCATACGPNGPAGQTGTLCGGPSYATTTCCASGAATCLNGTCFSFCTFGAPANCGPGDATCCSCEFTPDVVGSPVLHACEDCNAAPGCTTSSDCAPGNACVAAVGCGGRLTCQPVCPCA